MVNTTRADISVNGTQNITGAGFKPKGYVVIGGISNGNAPFIGIVDSAAGQSHIDNYYGVTAGRWITDDNSAIGTIHIDATHSTRITHTSFDDDGATITWTKTSSPTGAAQLKFLFFG
ncbi:MAG: hypothetical protein CMI54_08530 [Parcubacteria group bacterium]|jgi:hypothetical protein|nr:hypothetical protein [Parcubacteria group bacterium]|tara:strand:+ start:12124 stop:12477 length:354 start_codon:yes stop_codon:yes gene_type:complete